MLFIETQRKLNFYLRALWGRDFFLRPTGADYTDFKPYIEKHIVHMPDAVDAMGISPAWSCTVQLRRTWPHTYVIPRPPFPPNGLSPAQMFFIGLAEDARIEYKAQGISRA